MIINFCWFILWLLIFYHHLLSWHHCTRFLNERKFVSVIMCQLKMSFPVPGMSFIEKAIIMPCHLFVNWHKQLIVLSLLSNIISTNSLYLSVGGYKTKHFIISNAQSEGKVRKVELDEQEQNMVFFLIFFMKSIVIARN